MGRITLKNQYQKIPFVKYFFGVFVIVQFPQFRMPEIKMERLHLFGVFVLHSKTFITLTYPVFLAELEINHECPCCLFRHDLFEKNIYSSS